MGSRRNSMTIQGQDDSTRPETCQDMSQTRHGGTGWGYKLEMRLEPPRYVLFFVFFCSFYLLCVFQASSPHHCGVYSFPHLRPGRFKKNLFLFINVLSIIGSWWWHNSTPWPHTSTRLQLQNAINNWNDAANMTVVVKWWAEETGMKQQRQTTRVQHVVWA